MTQSEISSLKKRQETLESKGRKQFNNTKLPYDKRVEGLDKIEKARGMLTQICEAQHALNMSS